MSKSNQYGSQLQIINWLDEVENGLQGEQFRSEFNSLIQKHGIELENLKSIYPKGSKNDKEITLPEFLKYHNPFKVDLNFKGWWAPKGGKTPTWDLISLCKSNGNVGILLVEAKAHSGEFDYGGKRIDDTDSLNSHKNHIKIGECISEASRELSLATVTCFQMSISTHYQLCNRFTWAWKLASSGIPVCLVYLGFLGEKYFEKDYFIDENDWNSKLDKYLEGIVPKGFSGVILNGTEFKFCRISK